MNAQPEVSVITVTYNCAEYLPACIESVRQQTMPDFEHLILDNGSTDGSGKSLRMLQHDRLRLFGGPKLTVSEARNRLIAEARGKYIAILDADDKCMPTRLEKQLSKMRAEPDLVGVGTWFQRWYQKDDARVKARYPVRPAEIAALYRAGIGVVAHSTFLMTKAAFLEAGGYNAALSFAEDFDLIYRLTQMSPIGVVDDYLVEYCMRHLDVDPATRERTLGLHHLSLAYGFLIRSGVKDVNPAPPFERLNESNAVIIGRAKPLVAKACRRGLFSPRSDIGIRCRLLFGVRLAQILRS